jgi:hypothetical protein
VRGRISKENQMIKKIGLSLAIGALVLSLVPVALAGKGTGGKGKPGGGGTTGGSGTISLTMVSDINGNGAPNWGDTITFHVSTTATTNPYVEVTCYQGTTLVYSAWAGFYDSYPWPGQRLMPLSSPSWASGAADCRAVLNSGLATLTFHVNA